jgi:hypothetical protein
MVTAWLLRSPLIYCETASLHRAFTVIESILNLWPISLLVLASFPARPRPRTMGVRILYSPSLELVNEKLAFSSGELGAWEELVLVRVKEL